MVHVIAGTANALGENDLEEGLKMAGGKSATIWKVNVLSFILFIGLVLTGLLNWLVLPRGYEARGGFLISLRHFLVAVHEWGGLIFVIVIIVHLVLHGTYIKTQLQKYGIMK